MFGSGLSFVFPLGTHRFIYFDLLDISFYKIGIVKKINTFHPIYT